MRLPAFRLRRCSGCRDTKPLVDFVRNRSTPSGYGNYCKSCHNAISRRNRERRHGSSRAYLLRHRYDVDACEIDAILLRQEGLCAICLHAPARHVDHDHQSGRIRGVLCFSCNGGLGQFADDSQRIARAIAYLEAADRRFRAMQGREPTMLLCVVCREWLPREVFSDDYRRHRGKVQWCQMCGESAGRSAIDLLNHGARRYHLLTKYRIDVHEVEALIADQGRVCAICECGPAEQVDHDHRSRFVRGVLCGGCNAGLGQLKENVQTLRAAIAYLRKWLEPPHAVREPAASYILSVA